jgi:hypothetical protein
MRVRVSFADDIECDYSPEFRFNSWRKPVKEVCDYYNIELPEERDPYSAAFTFDLEINTLGQLLELIDVAGAIVIDRERIIIYNGYLES